MADSFFGFDTSLSNLNDDEGAGEPSEDEYDALNDETFGHGSDEYDWEFEHEQRAEIHESSRRHNVSFDDSSLQIEASLSQLVLDDTDAPLPRTLGSSVWRSDLPFPAPPTPVPTLKNVCTVEELERQLRQKQMPQLPQQPQVYNAQNYYQPRFPPVILQRPPGLQAPVSLPFATQQTMTHNLNQMSQHNQSLNKIIGSNNQMGQNNQLMMNHVNQMGQNMNQMGQNVNQMGPPPPMNQMTQNMNQFMQNTAQMNQFHNNQMGQNNMMNMQQTMQNVHPMGQSNQLMQNPINQNINMNIPQNMNQMGQNVNHLNQNVIMGQNMSQLNQNVPPMPQNINQHHQNLQINQNMTQHNQNMPPMGQNIPQMNQNVNQMGPNINQIGPSMNQIGPNVNQMGQNINKMPQNVNQMGQNVNQMMPNGNQFGQMNQYPHSMGQTRMIAPPPGMNMPRQNFSPNVPPQLNPTFRGQTMTKPEQQPTLNQQMMIKNQQQQIAKPAPTTQSPQNAAPSAKKTEQKQKTRVYNSNNLTSQNLVHLIQNTQAWMVKNNCYNNANHHPMLNRTMFNNHNNMGMMNHRQNGMYNNSMSPMNGDDSGSDTDEYAGLMTQREKQWLINIQMLQLNTGTPYIHDFYYTVFLERQSNKEKEGVKEAHKANQQNHPFYSGAVKQESHGHRERHNSNRHNSTGEEGATPRTYVPTQFENSLGKLQCGSVTAPRKIIDVELVGADPAPPRSSRAPSVASTTTAEAPREMKRTKQLLLDIEALFLILLRLEEMNDPLAIANAVILREREEKQKQLEAAQKEMDDEEEDTNLFLKNIESVQRRPKQDSPKSENIDKRQVVNLTILQKPAPVKNLLDEDKDELVNKMFSGLLHGDRIGQMLTVRKGRTLMSRFLSRAGSTHARLRSLWARILRAIPSAARRDDGSLMTLAPHYTNYIQKTTGWSAVLESCGMLSEALDPARTPHALTTAFTLTAVCALIEKACTLVNTPDTTSNERQWFKFLKSLARALKNTTLAVSRPLKPLPDTKLIYHVKYLDSRSTVEILQRGKSADFADLTKTEILELLVKYLC